MHIPSGRSVSVPDSVARSIISTQGRYSAKALVCWMTRRVVSHALTRRSLASTANTRRPRLRETLMRCSTST
ncbi:hypothetical protein C7H84_05980 [Burkholderia sp. Nafp2/4-1b]|nr:hypothetical protein C7H84_05980 [Burkholderia sp. Nafp2/4-1b]